MKHLVITIGCEYGAKGNAIGKKIAQDLGIKFYDRDLVDEIIKEVGIPTDIMDRVEEGGTIAGKGAQGDVRGSFFQICGSDRPRYSCTEADYPEAGSERSLCDHRTVCRLYSERYRRNPAGESIYLCT